MPVRELHLHPLLMREACYTEDVAHAVDQLVLDLAQGCRQQVPPCVPHEVSLTVLHLTLQVCSQERAHCKPLPLMPWQTPHHRSCHARNRCNTSSNRA